MIERVYTALASTIRARQIRRCVQLQYSTFCTPLYCYIVKQYLHIAITFFYWFLVVSMDSLSDQQRENIQKMIDERLGQKISEAGMPACSSS